MPQFPTLNLRKRPFSVVQCEFKVSQWTVPRVFCHRSSGGVVSNPNGHGDRVNRGWAGWEGRVGG